MYIYQISLNKITLTCMYIYFCNFQIMKQITVATVESNRAIMYIITLQYGKNDCSIEWQQSVALW